MVELVGQVQKKGRDCAGNYQRWCQWTEQKLKSQQGTLVNSEIPSSEDLQHKETCHVNQNAMQLKSWLTCFHKI